MQYIEARAAVLRILAAEGEKQATSSSSTVVRAGETPARFFSEEK